MRLEPTEEPGRALGGASFPEPDVEQLSRRMWFAYEARHMFEGWGSRYFVRATVPTCEDARDAGLRVCEGLELFD